MEEKDLLTNDEGCAGNKDAVCPEDEGEDLSLDNTSPEELDRLWDDADEDELEECASEKKCDKKKCIIAAVIVGIIAAAAAYLIYRLVKSRRKDE